MFIDASREYADEKKQNRLREQDIEKIVSTFRAGIDVRQYAHRASVEEIRENQYNLNIPRYVDTFEMKVDVDIRAVQRKISEIEEEIASTRSQMAVYLKELGL